MGYSCTGVLKWKCDTIIESEVDNQIVSNELISNSTGNKEKRRVKSGREDGKKGDYFTDYHVGQDGLRFVLPTYLFLKYFVRMNSKWQIIGPYRAHGWGFTIGSCIAAGGIICSFWRKIVVFFHLRCLTFLALFTFLGILTLGTLLLFA